MLKQNQGTWHHHTGYPDVISEISYKSPLPKIFYFSHMAMASFAETPAKIIARIPSA